MSLEQEKVKKSRPRSVCSIEENNDNIPQLVRECTGQDKVDGYKCFFKKCRKVTQIISDSDLVSYGGTVVRIFDRDLNKQIIVKWNRYPNSELHLNEIINEIKIQKFIFNMDPSIVPKIYEVYKYSLEKGIYIYILMEDLEAEGFESYDKIVKNTDKWSWKKIKNSVRGLVLLSLKKLHKCNIAHKDLHMKNIFINLEKNLVKFIDFGHSEQVPNSSIAENIDFDIIENGIKELKN